jgi:hypothetical protein
MRSQSSEGRISRAIQVHYASFPCCTRVLLPLLNQKYMKSMVLIH